MSRFERQPFIKAVDDAIESPPLWSFLRRLFQISVALYRIIYPHQLRLLSIVQFWEIDIQTSIYVVDCPSLISYEIRSASLRGFPVAMIYISY